VRVARGVSTVLDVAVCLLLVGTAVATLAAAPPSSGDDPPDADVPARTVATTTTAVPVDNRTRHGPLAAHLASAAITGATVDGRRILEVSYPKTVRETTAGATDEGVFVTSSWEPYPDAAVRGRLEAGEKPSTSADVSAAMLTVESGIEPPGPDASDSFRALARALASAWVNWLFPPERTRVALVDPRTGSRTAARYRSVGDAFGTDVDAAVTDADVMTANEALADALATQFETDLRASYTTPGAAASEITIHEVTIVVRRWDQ